MKSNGSVLFFTVVKEFTVVYWNVPVASICYATATWRKNTEKLILDWIWLADTQCWTKTLVRQTKQNKQKKQHNLTRTLLSTEPCDFPTRNLNSHFKQKPRGSLTSPGLFSNPSTSGSRKPCSKFSLTLSGSLWTSMKAEYSSMRSLEEAMVRSCHTGTAVALGGGGGANGSKPATNTHNHKNGYNLDAHSLGNLSQIFTSNLLGMDCGIGPDRLGYGGCAKGLILKDNECFTEGQYRMIVADGSYCISDKCFFFFQIVKNLLVKEYVLLHQLGVSPPASLLLDDAKQHL